MKEKSFDIQHAIQQSISQINRNFHRIKRQERASSYASIVTAILIIAVSLLTTTDWLFWVGLVSILSNAILLILTFIKK